MTKPITMELLKRAADNLEIRFMSPVYLVGSFQHKYEEAHDIDIVMVITKDRAIRLFGSEKFNDKRVSFQWKQKLEIEKYVHNFDIDFKVQIQEHFESFDKSKTKLGSYAHVAE